jgi:nucleotidyltransferase/DNA polymerase involved in DNA repair
MATIDTLAPATETSSIDEAFVHLDYGRQEQDARMIRQTIKRWTGIPTSIGLALGFVRQEKSC